LQDPSEASEDNVNKGRLEASRHFRNKKQEYLIDKIKLESNRKNKKIGDMYRGITEFKEGYNPRTSLVKDERGNHRAHPHKTANRWKDYFCQVLNVQRTGDVRQTEIHTAEPFVPEPNAAEVEKI
jgi:hypothetical protein